MWSEPGSPENSEAQITQALAVLAHSPGCILTLCRQSPGKKHTTEQKKEKQ
jgi:hypothetical protein